MTTPRKVKTIKVFPLVAGERAYRIQIDGQDVEQVLRYSIVHVPQTLPVFIIYRQDRSGHHANGTEYKTESASFNFEKLEIQA